MAVVAAIRKVVGKVPWTRQRDFDLVVVRFLRGGLALVGWGEDPFVGGLGYHVGGCPGR